MSKIITTVAHVRQARLCTGGARKWFEHYGFSWDDFVTNGKAAEELEATGDPLAFKVTAISRQESNNGKY